jgi:hypothetical protein
MRSTSSTNVAAASRRRARDRTDVVAPWFSTAESAMSKSQAHITTMSQRSSTEWGAGATDATRARRLKTQTLETIPIIAGV